MCGQAKRGNKKPGRLSRLLFCRRSRWAYTIVVSVCEGDHVITPESGSKQHSVFAAYYALVGQLCGLVAVSP